MTKSEVSAAWVEYLSRVQDRYGRVDLEILAPLTEQGKHPVMLLEQIFVPQRVRADLPPVEVPREVWQRLADAGLVDGDTLPEQFDRDKLKAQLDDYRTRPTRAVLDLVSDPAERNWRCSAIRARVSQPWQDFSCWRWLTGLEHLPVADPLQPMVCWRQPVQRPGPG